MANTFAVADWVSMETLRILKNKLEVAQFFNTDYEKDFGQSFAVGDTIRVKYPQRFITRRDSLAYDPQSITKRETSVTVDKIIGVDFEWDSVEKALKMERGRDAVKKQYLDPAAAQIAQDLDSAAALWAKNHTPNIVGVLGTAPTAFSSISGAARQRLVEIGAPAGGERGMIVPPKVTNALTASAVAYFNPASDISKQYKEGSIGRQGGFDWYESMSLYNHVAGTWAGVVEMLAASVSGATTLSLTATTGDTFKEGDVISIAGVYEVNPSTRRSTGTLKQFVVRADVTAAASAATITISPTIYGPGSQYQNVDALPAAGADLTLFPGTSSPSAKQGINGLAIHPDAFALVGVQLELPKNAEIASRATDPDTGLSVRFIRMFDPVQSKMINRFDVLFGFGDLYPDACAVRVLSN
jgi:hypothetical protein